MTFLSKLIYFYKRKIHPGFEVGRDELVIDIGSGDKPFWRADVFFDNLSLDNNQRFTGGNTTTNLGLFINGNLPETPFKDKIFDFSFCAHLLEHVDDPRKAIQELMRISKRGYIEVPNGICETIQPFRSHLWLVFKDEDKLVFVRKSKRMHEIFKANGQRSGHLLKKIKDPFIRFYWEENIPSEIIDDLKESDKFAPSEEELSPPAFDLYLIFVKTMRRIFYKNKNVAEGDIKKQEKYL